jgi:hypothetical protein
MGENINFFLNDDLDELNNLNELNNIDNLNNIDDNNITLTDILKEINDDEEIYLQNTENLYHEVVNYNINYTVKQLLQICEYYNISKAVKMTKCNKEEIINTIVLFESNQDNYNIVCRRKQLCFYINELKDDKLMKQFVLWK